MKYTNYPKHFLLKLDKKKFCLEVSKELYKKLQGTIVYKFGSTYGNIRIAIEEGIAMWIKEQQSSIDNEFFCQAQI